MMILILLVSLTNCISGHPVLQVQVRMQEEGSSRKLRVVPGQVFLLEHGNQESQGKPRETRNPGGKVWELGGGAFMVLTIHGQLNKTNFYHNSFKCIYWISQFQIKPRKHVLSRLYRLLYFYAPLNIQNIHTGLQKQVCLCNLARCIKHPKN